MVADSKLPRFLASTSHFSPHSTIKSARTLSPTEPDWYYNNGSWSPRPPAHQFQVYWPCIRSQIQHTHMHASTHTHLCTYIRNLRFSHHTYVHHFHTIKSSSINSVIVHLPHHNQAISPRLANSAQNNDSALVTRVAIQGASRHAVTHLPHHGRCLKSKSKREAKHIALPTGHQAPNRRYVSYPFYTPTLTVPRCVAN